MGPELLHRELTQRIIKVFYDVYNELGHGFLESVYQQAMLFELRTTGICADKEVPIPVHYRGTPVGIFYADLLVNGCVLLELKAARALDAAHEAQLLHYLRATDVEVGLLLNFGNKPQFRRLLFDNERKKIRLNPRESVAESLVE